MTNNLGITLNFAKLRDILLRNFGLLSLGLCLLSTACSFVNQGDTLPVQQPSTISSEIQLTPSSSYPFVEDQPNPTMTAGGSRRLYPRLSKDISALDTYHDAFIIAAGYDGYMHHNLAEDERSWTRVDFNYYEIPHVWAIEMVAENEFWGVGQFGKLAHFYNETRDVFEYSDDHFWDIQMPSPHEIWIVGENGAVLHHSGQRWQASKPITQTLYALDFVAPNEAWAAGRNGTLLHYLDGAWQLVPSPTQEHLRGLDMVSATLGWAVGVNGVILHFNGQTWQTVSSPTTTNLHSISAPTPDVAWAVGRNGVMVYFDGNHWKIGPHLTDDDMWTVLMLSPDEGWAASEGYPGVLLHYVNEEWKFVSCPMPRVTAADMTDNAGWIFGLNNFDDPMAMYYVDKKWRSAPEVDFGINNVDMVSDDEAWAVGEGKSLYHWVTGSWQRVVAPCELFDVQMIDADHGWAVGRGCSLYYQDGAWHSAPIPSDWVMTSLSLLSADEGWAEGSFHFKSTFFHLHQGRWEMVESPIDPIGRIAAVSDDKVWFSGNPNFKKWGLYSFTQTPEQPELILEEDFDSYFADITVVSPNEGWVLTKRGNVYHYYEQQWQLAARLDDFIGESGELVVQPNGRVWIFGDDGAFWQLME